MSYLLKNPRGVIVEIDDKEQWKKFLKKRGFDFVEEEEEEAFNLKQTARTSPTTPQGNDYIDIHFISPEQNHDGYGESRNLLANSLLEYGFRLSETYTGQEIAITYGYPESVGKSQSPVNILFSMFESTKLPDEWQGDLKRFDLIITPSRFCQKAFKDAGFEAEVVNLGYDKDLFKYQAKNINKEPFTFLHYNAFDQRKGWDLVFEAFNKEFKSEGVKLILKSTKSQLTMPITKHQYPNIEVIKEPYSHKKMAELLHRSDCFVLPSRGEGFGVPPLEALATGTPTIIPNAHGFADYFTSNYFLEVDVKKEIPAMYARFKGVDTGKMIECDVKSLQNQMRFAYEHREYITDMARDGSKWVASNYTYKQTGAKLAVALKEFLKGRPALKKIKSIVDKRTDGEKAPVNPDANKIIFLTEDTRHITGGRYYSWWLATALKAANKDVVIYTNRYPVFLKDFADYPQPEVRIVDNLDKVDVEGRCYVGSPIIGSEVACRLGQRYNKPVYVEIFDPFPMMEEFKGKNTWKGWDKLIPAMRKPNVNIISLCKVTSSYIYDWLMKRHDQVFEVYPCINEIAREKTADGEAENIITFISRLDHHKNVDHVLDAVKDTGMELHVITSIDGIGFPKMLAERKMQSQVVMHHFSSDKEKFEIIKKSKATINGAIYEGFGMWLAESLSCGVPAVCYDFPTFHEIEEASGVDGKVLYAKYNDPKDLAKQLKKALKVDRGSGTKAFNFPAMVKRMKEVFSFEPKIGVITIGLNEQEYIGASLRSVVKQKNVAKVAVVEGCVNLNSDQADKNGLSKDMTSREVTDVINEDKNGHKIIYERYGWAANKSELRNKALHLLGKSMDYILVVDADEAWKVADFNRLVKHVKENPDVSVVWFPAYHFWKKRNQLAVGSQWDKHLFRFFKYEDKTLHWFKHQTPVVNKMAQSVTQLGRESVLKNVHFYHYGYCKPGDKVRAKLEFYKKRDKDLNVVDTWTSWKKGMPTQPTHGDGSTKLFNDKHPPEVEFLWKK